MLEEFRQRRTHHLLDLSKELVMNWLSNGSTSPFYYLYIKDDNLFAKSNLQITSTVPFSF